MPIPDFQTLMLPLLELLRDGQEHTLSQTRESLASRFNLTDEEKATLLPSGRQSVFFNRVGWARTHLKKAGLLDAPREGVMKITPSGVEVLKEGLPKLTLGYLDRFESHREFRTSETKRDKGLNTPQEQSGASSNAGLSQTPLEQLEAAHTRLKAELASELISRLKSCSPEFFETLVVRLLVAMGYGGNFVDAAKAVGKTGDGGIDGIIKEDRLGLDVIYIQAKRWENSIGRPEVQKFAGALLGQKAKKGVFITSSWFTSEAVNFAQSLDAKLILIDGAKVADLMIEFGVGVSEQQSYVIKRIDEDFFVS